MRESREIEIKICDDWQALIEGVNFITRIYPEYDSEHFIDNVTNLYDKNAVQIYTQSGQLLGYIPRYYSETFTEFIAENRVKKANILSIEKNKDCDECIKIEVNVSELK